MKKLLLTFFVFSFTLLALKAQSYIITTIAGIDTLGFSGDGGAATLAELHDPSGVSVDAIGNIYIGDRNNNRIRKINTNGIISTIAGINVSGYSGDGGAATDAELNWSEGVLADASGNIFITDAFNDRIRKINSSGIISTIAGNGTAGYNGDNIPATSAELYIPAGVSVDASGNIYIADFDNARLRKVSTSGIITTLAGNGYAGYDGDNIAATSAELDNPSGVSLDVSGNIYIATEGDNRIRMINTSGLISTIAGNGALGHSGDGGPATSAELFQPNGVLVDVSGNIYIATSDSRIRKINTNSIISTIAGNGTSGYNGDNIPATSAKLNVPNGITLDASGNIYIGDLFNQRIRKLTPVFTGINAVKETNDAVTIFPNPNSGQFNLVINGLGSVVSENIIEIYNILGEKVYCETLKQIHGNNAINLSSQPNGIYFYRVVDETGTMLGEGKIAVQK